MISNVDAEKTKRLPEFYLIDKPFLKTNQAVIAEMNRWQGRVVLLSQGHLAELSLGSSADLVVAVITGGAFEDRVMIPSDSLLRQIAHDPVQTFKVLDILGKDVANTTSFIDLFKLTKSAKLIRQLKREIRQKDKNDHQAISSMNLELTDLENEKELVIQQLRSTKPDLVEKYQVVRQLLAQLNTFAHELKRLRMADEMSDEEIYALFTLFKIDNSQAKELNIEKIMTLTFISYLRVYLEKFGVSLNTFDLKVVDAFGAYVRQRNGILSDLGLLANNRPT